MKCRKNDVNVLTDFLQVYNQSLYSKKSIHKAILNGTRSLHYYPHQPQLIPEGLVPRPHKMHMSIKDAFKRKQRSTNSIDVSNPLEATGKFVFESKIIELFDSCKFRILTENIDVGKVKKYIVFNMITKFRRQANACVYIIN